ncbi:4338_t:CDS:1, partial [Ambispora gerdemannii]
LHMETTDQELSSLSKQLKLILNDEKYSDLKIKCGNSSSTDKQEETLYTYRGILVARSKFFKSMLSNGMKESALDEIFFSDIKASTMKIILEYLYMGVVDEACFSSEVIVPLYINANYFLLNGLEDIIVKFVLKSLKDIEIYKVAGMLSEITKISNSSENKLEKILIEKLSTIQLSAIPFEAFNMEGLLSFLSQSLNQENFITCEYSVLQYVILWNDKNSSIIKYNFFDSRLPSWTDLVKNGAKKYEIKADDAISADRIKKTFSTFIPFINLKLIDPSILAYIIHPLRIIPAEILLETYQYYHKGQQQQLLTYREFGNRKGELSWDPDFSASLTLFTDNKIVRALAILQSSVRAKNLISQPGYYQWMFIIEKSCGYAWVGICTDEDTIDMDQWLGQTPYGWFLGSSGEKAHKNVRKEYADSFDTGAIITIHLDMFKRSIKFLINRKEFGDAYDNLPE